jgi:hypothetical protein
MEKGAKKRQSIGKKEIVKKRKHWIKSIGHIGGKERVNSSEVNLSSKI